MIVASVPAGAVPGKNTITVSKGASTSNGFTYTVLSGDQNQVIFHVQANTVWGENIYIVGSIPELGNWDPDYSTEAMMCPGYPEWFLPVSLPCGTSFEFKFIRKDASGHVVWESGNNRTFTSAAGSSSTVDTPIYTWQP